MIITDFSQIFLAPVHTDNVAATAVRNPSEESKNILKHMVYNSLRARYKEFAGRYGNELVIACDSKSWRYSEFPEYKWKRRESKKSDTSGIKWDFVQETLAEMILEIQENFPFIVVKADGAEGDDVIGTLTKMWSMQGEENMFGDIEAPPVLISSSDRDNFQLHVYKNVKQWSPLTKKLVKPDEKPDIAILRKIVTGDSGDGIPNIRMGDDTFVTGTRQKPITEKFMQPFLDNIKNPIIGCGADLELQRNFIRNEKLISYEKTPQKIADDIISIYNYNKQHVSKNKMKLMTYFSDRKMNQLYAAVSDFY